MRQERKDVLRFDNLGRGLERRLDVANERCAWAAAAGGCDACADSCFACAAYPALLWVATGPSSQMTFSVWRALLACHQLSATIATPEASELLPRPATASTMNACLMPGSRFTSSRLALTALPPNTGHFSNTADSIPGGSTSMLNIGLPVTMSALSTPLIGLPMILKFFGSL